MKKFCQKHAVLAARNANRNFVAVFHKAVSFQRKNKPCPDCFSELFKQTAFHFSTERQLFHNSPNWSGWWDLNSWPHGPEPCALPLRYTPLVIIYHTFVFFANNKKLIFKKRESKKLSPTELWRSAHLSDRHLNKCFSMFIIIII